MVTVLLILRTFVRNDIMNLIIIRVLSRYINALETRFIRGAALFFLIYYSETTYMHTRALLSASTGEPVVGGGGVAGFGCSLP